jgi:hypothetical protein
MTRGESIQQLPSLPASPYPAAKSAARSFECIDLTICLDDDTWLVDLCYTTDTKFGKGSAQGRKGSARGRKNPDVLRDLIKKNDLSNIKNVRHAIIRGVILCV